MAPSATDGGAGPRPGVVAALLEAQRRGEVTAAELVERSLAAVRATQSLNAWIHVAEDEARARAAEIDRRRSRGEKLGPLAGVPIGVKDQIVTRGIPTTAGSRILEGWVPPYDATVIARLLAADAVILGKLNQDEFAMGSSSESSAAGPVRNPWDPARVPGGSSGGSAAAVAAGVCPVSLGTDTGGSIRQPASFCGLVGLKPTYGRVSRYGAVAFASSLDQIGPLGRTVADVAAVFSVIAGHDPKDATSLTAPVPTVDELVGPAGARLEGLRLGVPAELFTGGLDPFVRAAVDGAIKLLAAHGAALVPVELPHARHAVATYYLLATAEASSNLSRLDGVRFGHRTGSAVKDVAELYARSRAEGFGDEVKRRILLGTFALSHGYYDAYYKKAQQVRTLIRRDFEAAFATCDAIVTPTSPVTAFGLDERLGDPLQMYLMDVYTIPSSLAGNTSVSVPCGFDPLGLPIGLQLIGPPLGEARILRVASELERLLPADERKPWVFAEGC